MTAPRRLQLRRGNSTAVSSYTGAAGEVVIDTTNWTLRVHDGVTQGGYLVTANTTSLNANITQANLGLKGYVDLANTIQSQQISAANLGMKGYVDSVASQSIYGNSNVKSYLTGGFDANIIPAGNAVYSLGSITNQWRDLYVSNNTIYIGGIAVSTTGGTLTVGGNTIAGTNLVTYSGNVSASAISLDGATGHIGTISVLDPGVNIAPLNFYTIVGGSGTGAFTYVSDAYNPRFTFGDPGWGNGYRIGDVLTVVNSVQEAGYTNATIIVTGLVSTPAPAIFVGNTAYKFGADGNIRLPAGGGILDSTGVSVLDTYSNAEVASYLTVESYAKTNDITTANLGLKGYVDQANTIQSAQLTSANLGIIGYVDNSVSTANIGIKGYVDNQTYTNVNVTSYLVAETNKNIHGNVTVYGNLTVNGNVSYINVTNYTVADNIINLADLNPADSLDLGFVAHRTPSGQPLQHTGLVRDASSNQWRLFSNVVPAPGTTVDFTNAVYDDLQVGNITARTFIGNLTFPDSTIQTTAADFGYLDLDKDTIKGTADYQYTFATDGYFSGSTSSESPNYFFVTYNTINTNIASGWTVVGGTANTTVSNVTYPVPGYPGVIRVNLTVPAISTSGFYPVTVTSPDRLRVEIQPNPGTSDKFAFTTSGLTFPDATVQTTAYTGYGNVQVGVFTNLSNYAYNANVTAANVGLKGYVDFANTIMKAYVDGQITAANANVGISSYSNVQVATYLPTYTGTLAGSTLNLAGQDGTTVADFQTGAATNQIITLGSNYTFSIKAGDGASNRGSLVLESGRNSRVRVNGNGSNVLITAGNGTQSSTWTFANSGVLTFPDGTTQSTAGGAGSNYGNVNVKAYTESMGFQNYGNSNVTAYLNATGYNLYSNVNVAAYLSTATINTTGNITAQNLTGNISITGNVTGTSANVTLQAGAYTSVFDNQGNVRLPTAYVTGNVTANYFIGNGSQLTGLPSSYSNVQVATYLPTYSGNIANIRLGPSGVLTFADGTTQTTAGGGSYSNVQVAAYLTTGVNTAAPQIQLTNATSNFIKYNNVGVGAPTFTTSNVGTRIIYWSSVDANTADYAVGIDAGVLWHGIPRATSGFAFKWYAGTTQIAVLEGTGSFTIANIRLSPSGNIVFADGTVQTTAATGTYSNIQVATYLPTYGGALQSSNVQTTTANIQATTAATNTATGALRVMGGVGVAGTVFAGQLNTTGNLIANAISAYSLNTVANVVASVVNAGTINSAGNVLAQNLIGTIATASQTNITAVGTLATLTVSGNVNSSNFVGSTPNVQLIANTSITTFDVYGNVTFPGNNVISSLGITMPARPAFRVNGTAAPLTTANVNLKGSAITTIFNQGNYLDTTTGKFTAPVAGIYEVLLNARVGNFNGLSQIAVLKNGNNSQGNVVCFWEIGSTAGTANHFGVSGTINLVAGDYLSANILAGNISFDGNNNWCVTYLG